MNPERGAAHPSLCKEVNTDTMYGTAKEFFEARRDNARKTRDNAPQVAKAFAQMELALMADGALSAKTKELVALGIAVAEHCVPCIRAHIAAALEAVRILPGLGAGKQLASGRTSPLRWRRAQAGRRSWKRQAWRSSWPEGRPTSTSLLWWKRWTSSRRRSSPHGRLFSTLETDFSPGRGTLARFLQSLKAETLSSFLLLSP
ncbi:MAG: hypothetical protein KatS3mg024_2167 [Armatimonadota bacterium]|nr:MAG: hypothetical protein KatS3mg024_2167 [Armatimonadota bacterium]